jgi:hypothetical protein
MNKKILGIKLGTLLQFLVCVVLASIIWFVVQYTNSQADANTAALGVYFGSLLL